MGGNFLQVNHLFGLGQNAWRPGDSDIGGEQININMGSITMGSTFHFEGLNNLKFRTRKGVTQPKFWWWHTKKGI